MNAGEYRARRERASRRKTIDYNPPNEDGRRWVDHPEDGLRFVGYADDLVERIRHKGWYTMDDGEDGEVCRGVVYQLPSRGDGPIYVHGHQNSIDTSGASLCFRFNDFCDDKKDAARMADDDAEMHAEEQRDYNRAWRAGRNVEEKWDEAQVLIERIVDVYTLTHDAEIHPDPLLAERVFTEVVGDLDLQIDGLASEIEQLHDQHGDEPGYLE